MNLTEHFVLSEFIRSQVAARRGIDNRPTENVIQSLTRLCENILEPLRAELGKPIRINSGFRCPELNSAIGGSRFSQHMTGDASDIDVPELEPIIVAQTIIDLGLPFDQLIHEFQSWVHVSYDLDRSRGAVLTARLMDGRTQYVNGLI